MKISASVYSNKTRKPAELSVDLESFCVDYLHIDCNDDLNVFKDIHEIRKVCRLPIDLHIISSDPEKFFPYLIQEPVELLTFQFENLNRKPEIPQEIKSLKGLSIVSETPLEVFSDYEDYDFLLFMTTTPGQSGGQFNKENLKKIRRFKQHYPEKPVHVDGGVNGEIAFVLRNMGVDTVVSGSFLVNSETIGKALHQLRSSRVDSHMLVKDILIDTVELPVIEQEGAELIDVIQSIERHNLGFALIVNKDGLLNGVVTNADIRRLLIRKNLHLQGVALSEVINTDPAKINENISITEMLNYLKELSFPALFLPVVDYSGKLKGAVTFTNLIKGEL